MMSMAKGFVWAKEKMVEQDPILHICNTKLIESFKSGSISRGRMQN